MTMILKHFPLLLIVMVSILGLSACETTQPARVECYVWEKTGNVREIHTQKEISLIQKHAEGGDSIAQYQVAEWYEYGVCLPQNLNKAINWYMRSAQQSYLKAQIKLGEFYSHGVSYKSFSIPPNEKKAQKWLTQAAEQGDLSSQFRLAALYRNQLKDTDSAIKWYRAAASQGHILAMRSLGYIYLTGEGVNKDLIEAEKWFSLSAATGDAFSKVELEKMAKEKDPAAWEQKERARIAKRQEIRQVTQKWVLEDEILEAAQQRVLEERALARKKAKVAATRFGSIAIQVTETEETKFLRTESHLREVSTGDVSIGVIGDSIVGGAGVGATGMGLTWLGPVGAAVGAGIFGLAAIIKEIEEALDNRLSKEEKEQIKEEKEQIKVAVSRVSEALAEENRAKNLQSELLALSKQKQVQDLFTTSSAPYHMHVEVQEIGLFITPENPRNGRLWVAVEASLIDTANQSDQDHQRICYGSADSKSLISWGEPDGKTLRDGLTTAYRYIANKIQTDMVGLASHLGKPSWNKTDLACVKPALRESTASSGEK